MTFILKTLWFCHLGHVQHKPLDHGAKNFPTVIALGTFGINMFLIIFLNTFLTIWFLDATKDRNLPSFNFSFLVQLNRVSKCTLVQALRLCTGRTAHRGNRGIALPFHDHGTRSGWGVSVTPQPLFTPGKDPVPIVQEAGWGPGPVWTGAGNLAPTGIRSPDRPARSQSLYRLRYPELNRVIYLKCLRTRMYSLEEKSKRNLYYNGSWQLPHFIWAVLTD
jgi:hypothetical protein